MKIESLAAYSTASSLLLGLSNAANAQMTYFNIDPDATVFGDMDYPIDLNLDGIPEMTMHCVRWSLISSSGVYSSQGISFFNYAEIATLAGPLQLYAGDTVNADLDFNSYNQSFFYGYYSHGVVDIDAGASWINNDSYIGMRFEVDGNAHYGWIRVRLNQTDVDDMPGLIVKELAWNATPDAPAPINLHVGTAQFPTLADVGETNTAADLQLHFEKPEDESNVVVYRVMLYTGYVAPTLAEANAVTAERYTQVLPTGDDITINFNETTLDINGNPLISGTYYQAIILSIPDGIIVTGSDLSLPSNHRDYILREAPFAEDIYLSSTGYDDDITGLNGNFNMNYINVSSVRAYITDGLAVVEELLTLDSNYYMELTPVVGGNLVSFTADKLIYPSSIPVLFEKYYLTIVSIPDSITNSIPTYDYDNEYFKYQYYAGSPTVNIVDNTGTAADIHVQFPMFANEDNLDYYRIFIAKADEVVYPDNVYTVLFGKRIDLWPNGTDLDINLGSILFDTDGNSISPDQPYKVYVALKGKFAPDFFSLAAPSTEFILEEPLVEQIQESNLIAAPKIWADNNLIYIDGASEENHTIIILNDIGQEIIRKNFSGTNYELLIPDLPEGIYIIEIESGVVNYRQQIYLF